MASYAGGYVAGRISRFDGGRQGVAVWLISVLLGGIGLGLALLADAEYGCVALPVPAVFGVLAELWSVRVDRVLQVNRDRGWCSDWRGGGLRDVVGEPFGHADVVRLVELGENLQLRVRVRGPAPA